MKTNPFIWTLGWLWLSVIVLTGCGQSHKELKPEEIWSQVSPSVVRIEATSIEGDVLIGSGFVCELQGKKFILSNRHVVLGAKEVRVGKSENELVVAPSYHISADLDLALVDLPANLTIPPLKTREGGVKIGENVFAIGFPLGLSKSITQGLVSSETTQLVQFDAPISSGNSGGPLVDKDGMVLGVVTAGSMSSEKEIVQNLNFAIKATFIPKAELFNDPILAFYDAWRELVKYENQLIDELQDRRVFDVEVCVQNEMMLPYALVAIPEIASADPEKKEEVEKKMKASYAQNLSRVIERYGSLEAGVNSVVPFLRSKISELDKIPGMFIGVSSSDELLKSFAHDERKNSFFTSDIKPSEIVPMLNTSIEFAKAKYEDTAFKIDFYNRFIKKTRADTNFIATFMAELKSKANDKDIPGRTTVRLPYNELSTNLIDQFIMSFRCDETYGHRSSSPWRRRLADKNGDVFAKISPAEQFSEYGGFESAITSMFSRKALERAEQGDVHGAIEYAMNEVNLKRYPDLCTLAFLYTCNGDFDKAYELYAKAYIITLGEVDPFSLEHDYRSTRSFILGNILGNRNQDSVYPDQVRRNLAAWNRYIEAKPVFLIMKMPLTDAIEPSRLDPLSEFEKCWVLSQEHDRVYYANSPFGGDIIKFEAALKSNPEAFELYKKYIAPPDY